MQLPSLTLAWSDGHEHPVGYYSKKLLPSEQHYSTIEKECLAIKLAVEAFRVYLLGRRFVIQTDHRSLEWLEKLKESNARLCRWSLSLQPYTFEVQHRAGVLNQNADALSRSSATGLLQEKEEGMWAPGPTGMRNIKDYWSYMLGILDSWVVIGVISFGDIRVLQRSRVQGW